MVGWEEATGTKHVPIGGSRRTMRCPQCRFDNAPGVELCVVCGSMVGGIKCPRCETINPPDSRICGTCRHAFSVVAASKSDGRQAGVLESVPPRAPVPIPEGPSPVALIGFGAVLSLAAAAYPWYMWGEVQAQPTTLSQLLDVGWKGFPGTPLTMIAIAAVTSTTVSVVGGLATIRAAVSVISGLVTLLSATWLWEGFSRTQSDSADPTLPITGAVLAMIGAIVMIAVGSYLWSFQRARTARRATPAPHSHSAKGIPETASTD